MYLKRAHFYDYVSKHNSLSALHYNVKSVSLEYMLNHCFNNLLSCFKEVQLFCCVDYHTKAHVKYLIR